MKKKNPIKKHLLIIYIISLILVFLLSGSKAFVSVGSFISVIICSVVPFICIMFFYFLFYFIVVGMKANMEYDEEDEKSYFTEEQQAQMRESMKNADYTDPFGFFRDDHADD